jgi:hypothetical protein
MSVSSDLHRGPRPGNLSGCVDSEKGHSQSVVLNDSLPPSNICHNTRQRVRDAWHNIKMPSLRQCALAFLIALCLTTVYARRPIHFKQPDSGPGDDTAFQELLSDVSDASLHDVLHDVSDKYKHGIYPEDKTALKAIHKDNPAMATSLVRLARRQQNTTMSSSAPATSSMVLTTASVSTTDTTGQTTTAQDTTGSMTSAEVSSTFPIPSPRSSVGSLPPSSALPPPSFFSEPG